MTIDPIMHDFSQPETIKEIAEFIGITVEIIETVINEPDQSKLYTQHKIPKKNNSKDTRIVWEIESQGLRDAHRYLQRRFEAFVREKTNYPTENSHGYITGKSTRTNAAEHVKKRFILHADIKAFFPTITSTRLQNLFLTFGIKLNIAEILAKFLTINGNLALGLPCSPLLANLACLNLDKSLAELAGKYACKYTRYADDLTFSSDENLPERIEIETILRDEGFTLAAEKFRITKIGQSHFVTGLSVSDDIPRIPRKLKRRIRQELRFAKKFGLNDHLGRIKENDIQQSVNRIDGTIHYINGVEPELAENLLEVWVSILAESETQPGYRQDANRKPRIIKMFFDSLEIETGSGKLLVLGCLTTQDLEGLNKESNEIIRQ